MPTKPTKRKAKPSIAKRSTAPRKPARSKYLDKLIFQIRAFRLPVPEQEVVFHPTRKWRMDLAWPNLKIAVEYQGGIFTGQASHTSIPNILRDQEKNNEAQILGWIVIYANARTVESAQAVDHIRRAIETRTGA